MRDPLANDGTLAGRTILFVRPRVERTGPNRALLDGIRAVKEGGGLAVLAAPARSRREVISLLGRIRPDVVCVDADARPLWIGPARRRGVSVLGPQPAADGAVALPIDVARSSSPARTTLDGALRILVVGRLARRGGAEVAIDALGLLVDSGVPATLDLVGVPTPATAGFEAALVLRIAALGLTGRVRMYAQTSDLWPHLEHADVVVLPTLARESEDGAVQALLAARPVIVTDTAALRRATAGYLSPRVVAAGDASALASSLVDVRRHWDTVRIDAAVDAMSANERHSPERFRETVRALLVDLTAGAPAPRFRTTARASARLTTNEV